MKLSRKTFFKGLALGTLTLPFLLRSLNQKGFAQSDPAQGPNIITAKQYRWKMVTTWPPNFPVIGEACNLFAKLVAEMSAERIQIRVYGGGELVPPLEAFDTVRTGGAEMGSGGAYYWAGKAPAAQFFASVPFGMTAQQVNAWIYSGGGKQLWEELYSDFNLVPMLGGNTGVQMGGWYNREINTINDFKGLKMRIPGLGGKVLEKAGGAPILMAGGEIYTGLERGIIDATEWLGPFHDTLMGFHEIAKYYYFPGWHEPGTALEFFINKKIYDRLPNDLQSILQAAAAQVNLWCLSEMEARNGEALTQLVEKGVQLRQFSDEIMNQLRLYTQESIAEITNGDPFSKKVYDSYEAFRKKMANYSIVSEKAFYNNIQPEAALRIG